jgi:hypothetical protein
MSDTGQNAAHDDTLIPSSQWFEHDCAARRGVMLLLGEKCPHCGHIAGAMMPTMTLVVAPFERAGDSVAYGDLVFPVNWQEAE